MHNMYLFQFRSRNGQLVIILVLVSISLIAYMCYLVLSFEIVTPVDKVFILGENDRKIPPTSSYIVNTSTCKIPDLDPWHESVRFIDEACSDTDVPNCKVKDGKDWMYSQDLNLIINHTAIHSNGYSWSTIRCCYRVIERVEQSLEKYDLNADNIVKLGKTCLGIDNKTVNHIPHEFIKVFCMSTLFPLFGDILYKEYFAFAKFDAHAQEKVSMWQSDQSLERPPNVILLGLDCNSRFNSYRRLHKTLAVLRKIGAVEMFGYTKVGENTFPNTVPFLAGLSVEEMESFCSMNESMNQDDCPYIWKNFDKADYLTATLDETPYLTSFNYHKAGFVFKPTDFYYRPFTLGYMKPLRLDAWHAKCLGHRRNDEVQLDYMSDIIRMGFLYKTPVFIHSWFSTYTHACIHNAQLQDSQFSSFIQDIVDNYNNTVLFFMSDHGERYGRFRETVLGWYEDKLPAMWVYLSPDLKDKFPDWHSALKINSRRLTSPFDLYHTLMHILHTFYKEISGKSFENKTVSQRKGQPLFKSIVQNRTCQDAGIPRGYCACTKPEEIDLKNLSSASNKTLNEIAFTVIIYLRKVLPQDCATPTLKEIVDAKFINKTINPHESVGIYILSMYTEPGDFLFEATVKAQKDVQGKVNYAVENLDDILRMNKINRKVDCVGSAQLERYCYCK